MCTCGKIHTTLRLSRRGFVGGALALATLGASCTPRRSGGPALVGVRTSNCQIPFFVAQRQKLYQQASVAVDLRLVPSNTELIEALKRGDLDAGSLPITTAIAAMAAGVPIRIVAMSGRGSDGLLVRAEDPIRALEDLRGRPVVTIRASILDVLLRYALETAGLDADADLDLRFLSQLGDMITALRTGEVDATSNTEPFMTDAERQGWGRILGYYTSVWPDHPCCVVVARQAYAQEQPDPLMSLLRVHVDAVSWCNAHRREAATALVDTLDAFDVDLVEASLDPAKMRLDAHLLPDEVARMAHLMARYDLIPPDADPDAMVDDGPLTRALEATS
jgi:NitT/TauT family transport system substrate-binding protein